MYNVERKELFKSSIPRHYANLFTRVCKICGPLEEKFGKDISDFTDEEVIELLKSFQSTDLNGIINIRGSLKLYNKWCRDNGYTSALNAYNHITREQLLSTVEKPDNLVYSDVTKVIRTLSNPSDRAFLWCLLYGINGHHSEDILGIREEDISGDTITTVSGKKVTLPLDAISDIRKSCNTYVYYGQKRRWDYDPLDDHMLKKRNWSLEETEKRAGDRMTRKMDLINRITGLKYTRSMVKMAGFLHFVRKIIQDNPDLDSWTVFEHPDFIKVKNQYDLSDRYASLRSRYRYMI